MEAIYTRRPGSRLERLLLRLARNSRAPSPPAVRADFVLLNDDVDLS